MVATCNAQGGVPIRNFSGGSFEGADKVGGVDEGYRDELGKEPLSRERDFNRRADSVFDW